MFDTCDLSLDMVHYAEEVLEALEQLYIKEECGYTRQDICTWMLCQHFLDPAEA